MKHETRHDRFVSTHLTKSGEKIEVEVSVTFLNINQGRFYVFLKNGLNKKNYYKLSFLQNLKQMFLHQI